MSKLHELEGQDYENEYMQEVCRFKDAEKGLRGDDVAAALILRDMGQIELLTKLRQGQIHCLTAVDELSTYDELEFE